MKSYLYVLLLVVTSSLVAFQTPEERAEQIKDCQRIREMISQFEMSYACNLKDINHYHQIPDSNETKPLDKTSLVLGIVLLPVIIPCLIYHEFISDYYSQDNNIKREFQNAQIIKDMAFFKEKLKEKHCNAVK